MYSSVRMIDGNDLRQLRAARQRPLSHIRCAPRCGAVPHPGSRGVRASDFDNHAGPHRFEPRSSNRTVARELKTISAFPDVDRPDIPLTQAIGNRSILSCGKREPSGRHVILCAFYSVDRSLQSRLVELWLVLVLVVSHCLGSLTQLEPISVCMDE